MAVSLSSPRILRPVAGAVAWLLLGVTGIVGAGWGYGLFFASLLLLAGAAAAVALLALTRAFDTDRLRGSAAWLGLGGAWLYVCAVGALAGHYTLETFAGRMELKWILFGPAVLAALVVLDVGLYRMLVGRNMPTWSRYRARHSPRDRQPGGDAPHARRRRSPAPHPALGERFPLAQAHPHLLGVRADVRGGGCSRCSCARDSRRSAGRTSGR